MNYFEIITSYQKIIEENENLIKKMVLLLAQHDLLKDLNNEEEALKWIKTY